MDINKVTAVYFVGAGGIGMSALIRYFLAKGKRVGGYDKTPSDLTEELKKEGADIHYEDNVALIGEAFKSPDDTLVVYAPAVPESHTELTYFRAHGFEVMKRARVLGEITKSSRGLCVAGTHGKTTTSSMLAHLLKQSAVDCNAFLGGILKNYESNLMLSDTSDFTVIEADEFDRSFHWLTPYMAVITSADPDHLDIYGTHEALREAFSQFVGQIREGGALVVKQGVDLKIGNPGIRVYRYSYDEPCDFYARNVTLLEGGHYRYDLVTPGGVIEGCTLGIPGWVNIENAVAAVAALWCASERDGEPLDAERLREALASFEGVKRRFEFYVNTPRQVYMDDYAHHPRELAAAITSVKKMFPGRRLTALFQPHLYTRTRDFYREFAEALSHADRVVLLPIYPAREEPIPGVESEMIGRLLTVPWTICDRAELAEKVAAMDTDVVVSFGAGNIDACCGALAEKLREKA